MNRVPLHFVYSQEVKDSIYEIRNVDEYWDEFIYGRQVWILQTYCILKDYFQNITLGSHPKAGCINIIHGGCTGTIQEGKRFYFVNVRADKRSASWANYEIVQNKLQEAWKVAYVPHWPQPGLIKRKRNSSQIKTVAFLGAAEQNILRFYPVDQDLRSLGMCYKSMDRERWNDYSDIDLVLAIRTFDKSDVFSGKPPSKLLNAWWAEVPLIASNDSAYSQIGIPQINYITVSSYDEMLRVIKSLKHDPTYYQNIIKNGVLQRENYSRQSILNSWILLLKGKISPDFVCWEKKTLMGRCWGTFTRRIIRYCQQTS